MKTKLIHAIVAAALAAAPLVYAAEPVDLLASRDLADWDHVLADPEIAKEAVWSFNDTGHLVCKGKPVGYLATREAYRDFILEVEWRWPETPSNSGVLMRITGEKLPIPACIEAQLQHGAAGRLMGLRGTMIDGEGVTVAETGSIGRLSVLNKRAGSESQPGEWNRYLITAKGGEIVVELNGIEANRTTDADRSKGPIGLQSEGGPVEFRTVKLTPLD